MIRLDIDPEVEKLVVAAARARGVEPGQYAGKIVADAVSASPVADPTAEELLRGLRMLAEHATPVNNYPPDFFTREIIYGDHN
jgi:hypothetical protein